MKECYEHSPTQRGGKNSNVENVRFAKNPRIIMALLGLEFPKRFNQNIEKWNDLNLTELKGEIADYSENKEFVRFLSLLEEDIHLLKTGKVETINVKPYTTMTLKQSPN